MNKIKISAVSYTNTKPFIYGIEKSGLLNKIELSLDVPSVCANKLINNQVDIGLIPVAEIANVPNAKIISSYCISSNGAVNSVFIFSNLPIGEVKTLRLDEQSRTSNSLAKILLKLYYKIDVEFVNDDKIAADAIILIGDRTFGRKIDFAYSYDLGEEWLKFTGLPFVYAAWVANKNISEGFIIAFNTALKYGLNHRQQLLKELPSPQNFDLEDYLCNKLDFNLTADKRKAMALFLTYLAEL